MPPGSGNLVRGDVFGPSFGRKSDPAPVFGGRYTSLVNLQLSLGFATVISYNVI